MVARIQIIFEDSTYSEVDAGLLIAATGAIGIGWRRPENLAIGDYCNPKTTASRDTYPEPPLPARLELHRVTGVICVPRNESLWLATAAENGVTHLVRREATPP